MIHLKISVGLDDDDDDDDDEILTFVRCTSINLKWDLFNALFFLWVTWVRNRCVH